MRIGIIDADLLDQGTRHPNLALMKISGYNKQLGHEVRLLEAYSEVADCDQVFASKVFTATYFPEELCKRADVTRGGTGFFPEKGGRPLKRVIEHHMPDYDLYADYVEKRLASGAPRSRYSDYLDYSIGFATRGCFRKCPFCVNRKYDRAFRHASISEFVRGDRPYIHLWDDNFLAFAGWREVLQELEDFGKPFRFRQGLDIRLLTDERAKTLGATRYKGDFIFAFDDVRDRALIEQKLSIWRRHTGHETRLYVLCGYYSDGLDEVVSAFERIRIIMRYRCVPYIMRFNKCQNSRYMGLFTQLARWCNQPQFFKKMSFREFCEANQMYHKNSQTHCASYRVMSDFEAKHPDVARMYFDLKFETESVQN